MKKILSLAFLTLGLFVSTSANAQGVKFGIKGGLNVTDMHFSSEVFDKSNQMGGFIGPTVKFTLPIIGLGVDASALYDFRQAKLTDPSKQEKTVKQQQIAIPVNLRYTIGLGGTANAFLFAGPQWGINIGDKDFKWTDGSSYSLKESNFSVNAGVGVTLMDHLQISANYNIAMGKTADIEARKVVPDAIKNYKSRNNSWQIAVAYFF
ncbi:porin family protein [Prevotella falsenii]|uniref:porin family protein n=1 Tax=Prevotella falsenii TaxID=515414 RepID=UPI000468FA44|nr:porin family protein [Prevotella falsenii]